jgi:hypothetical protein
MSSCPTQSASLPELQDAFERTSTRISRSALERTSEQTARSFVNSRFLTFYGVFKSLNRNLEQLIDTQTTWNSYGSPIPNEVAIHNARSVLNALSTKLMFPERTVPSAEGGVAFTFVSPTRSRAVIESLNDGECYVLLYDLDGNSRTIEWPINDIEQGINLVEKMNSHLRS